MPDDPHDGVNARNAPTVPDIKGPVLPGDTVPEIVGHYVPPRPLPEALQHRTLDLKSIRLSDYADPRRALTERRLVSPPRPRRARFLPWLGAVGVSALLGGVAWLCFVALKQPAPNSVVTPAAPVAKDAFPVAPTARSKVRPLASAPVPVVEASAIPVQKRRPNETNKDALKKRKDPWLE